MGEGDSGRFDKYQRCGAYHWDALSSSVRDHNAITAARYRQVLAVCGPVEGRVVLDVGCGDAKLDAMLAQAGARLVVGVDNERTGIDVGRRRIAAECGTKTRRRITLCCADAYQLPVRAGTCDIVIMTEIIEHLSDPLRFVQEASATLSAEGVLVITTPYRTTEVPLDENDLRHFYPGELRRLIEGMFEDVEIRLSDPLWIVQLYTMGGWARSFRWIVNGLSIFAGTNVFLMCPPGRYAGQITVIARRPTR